jgi:multiple sugar transport system substrate-binding protein
MTKQQLLIIAGGGVAIVVVLLIFGLIKAPQPQPAHLVIWGIYDEGGVFQELITNYQKQNKHISVEYVKKSPIDYEKELINAFAADKGPDIWLIHNTWLPKHKDKIEPLPTELLSFNVFKQSFVDVVESDLSEDNKIYGLPLYVDTLALYYNKDFLNTAGIPSPPETWDELVEDLNKLIKKDQWGQIEKAGVALGTAENIDHATDILALLMLQNSTSMVSEDKKSATFNKGIYSETGVYYPGQDALRFYTDFANPSKRTYTWNRQMPSSVDAFINGKTAMMFNYADTIPTIKEKASYLNFGIAQIPQIKGRTFDIDYPNYWAFTVSKKSKAIGEAWKFILYLTQKDNAKKYLAEAKRPTGRRDLIDWQKDDLELGVFARQSLTARSWYEVDSAAIETILAQAIESVVLGQASVDKAIETAVSQVTLLMK